MRVPEYTQVKLLHTHRYILYRYIPVFTGIWNPLVNLDETTSDSSGNLFRSHDGIISAVNGQFLWSKTGTKEDIIKTIFEVKFTLNTQGM